MGWGDDSVDKSSATNASRPGFIPLNPSKKPGQWLVIVTEHCWRRCED